MYMYIFLPSQIQSHYASKNIQCIFDKTVETGRYFNNYKLFLQI